MTYLDAAYTILKTAGQLKSISLFSGLLLRQKACGGQQPISPR